MREAELSSYVMLVILVLILKSIEISLPCPEDVGKIGRTSLNLVFVFFSLFNWSLLLVVLLYCILVLGFPLRGCCICAQQQTCSSFSPAEVAHIDLQTSN